MHLIQIKDHIINIENIVTVDIFKNWLCILTLGNCIYNIYTKEKSGSGGIYIEVDVVTFVKIKDLFLRLVVDKFI